MEAKRKKELLEVLVAELATERGDEVPRGLDGLDVDALWPIFRGYVNTRPPWPATEGFLANQDELLQGMIAEAGIHTLGDATPSPEDPRLLLWRGDITTLAADAIVNAANSQMLGCWVPGHLCIDNAIHTFAGVQLRAECARLMEAQGYEEPTARAKVTGAYNLPCKRIVHTVGPIANGFPTSLHRAQLAQCYSSCLDAVAAEGPPSSGFRCIRTGLVGFPADQAVAIAVKAVRRWLDTHPDTSMSSVVFNVFSKSDEDLYARELAIRPVPSKGRQA